jgi:hypothetical protein
LDHRPTERRTSLSLLILSNLSMNKPVREIQKTKPKTQSPVIEKKSDLAVKPINDDVLVVC